MTVFDALAADLCERHSHSGQTVTLCGPADEHGNLACLTFAVEGKPGFLDLQDFGCFGAGKLYFRVHDGVLPATGLIDLFDPKSIDRIDAAFRALAANEPAIAVYAIITGTPIVESLESARC